MTGHIHVYTGDGKGKTTAALGLAVRACGAGLRVYIGQFIKSAETSEMKILRERFPEVTMEQYGHRGFIMGNPAAEDIASAQDGLAKLRQAMVHGGFDVVVADEANVAANMGLLRVEALLELADVKPENVELVFTGRGAPDQLIERADLVTEMRKVKHYFDEQTSARRGIES